jgi:hypothetical protein
LIDSAEATELLGICRSHFFRHQTDVIEKILRHCGLWEDASDRGPPATAATSYYKFIRRVQSIRLDRDEKRELLTLMMTEKGGTELPARALSDGTLRLLALSLLELERFTALEPQAAELVKLRYFIGLKND